MTKEEIQIRDAYIDGYLSAVDDIAPGKADPRGAAEESWRQRNS